MPPAFYDRGLIEDLFLQMDFSHRPACDPEIPSDIERQGSANDLLHAYFSDKVKKTGRISDLDFKTSVSSLYQRYEIALHEAGLIAERELKSAKTALAQVLGPQIS